MFLGQEYQIFDWFIIHFTENNGMAFGLEFAGDWGKLILSIFRICAVSVIGYVLYMIIEKGYPKGLIASTSLVFAGALGNILDSVFYGVMFTDSYNRVAELFPEGGGYAPMLYGKVVDMLYFPLIRGYFPEWLPIWGGEYFVFFRPVFNIADSAITVGIAIIVLFQSKYLKTDEDPPKESKAVEASETTEA